MRTESLELRLRAFRLPSFRPFQEAVCRSVVEGKDALLVMPTGILGRPEVEKV